MTTTTLAVKPRNSEIPFILDVFDASMPEGAARVVARCDTRTGQVWRTAGSAVTVSMKEIRKAISEASA